MESECWAECRNNKMDHKTDHRRRRSCDDDASGTQRRCQNRSHSRTDGTDIRSHKEPWCRLCKSTFPSAGRACCPPLSAPVNPTPAKPRFPTSRPEFARGSPTLGRVAKDSDKFPDDLRSASPSWNNWLG